MDKPSKAKKWFNPVCELDENTNKTADLKRSQTKELDNIVGTSETETKSKIAKCDTAILPNVNSKNWMKNFEPTSAEDLAVNNRKVLEVEEWMKCVTKESNSDMLLLTGPVGCGKTATVHQLAKKYKVKVTEWISPVDIDIPNDYGDYEFKEKQSKKFQDFVINAANFTSLLDNNLAKIVLVEDFPNTFTRTPSEFTDVLHQYRMRAKSPIILICSESNTENRNSVANLFTPALKQQFGIHHIAFNAASITCLKSALKRVADIIIKKYTAIYSIPTQDLIECVVNSSAGDIRSAVLNLHFACLKGSSQSLETSRIIDKENKSKSKTTRKKKASSKFTSLGKDQTVTILHGVGRALNPKVLAETNKLSHSPTEVIDQFLSQPTSFVNFLEENYLSHFSNIDHVQNAAAAISLADVMLAEWRERACQEYGMYIATAGLMTANKSPVSTWNPVRGPKNMRVQYPSAHEIPLIEPEHLYKGKVLVTDYKTFCNIIDSQKNLCKK